MYITINKKTLTQNMKKYEEEYKKEFVDDEEQLLVKTENDVVCEAGLEDGKLRIDVSNNVGFFSLFTNELTDDELLDLYEDIKIVIKEKANKIKKMLDVLEE
jgi:hypothetical protein